MGETRRKWNAGVCSKASDFLDLSRNVRGLMARVWKEVCLGGGKVALWGRPRGKSLAERGKAWGLRSGQGWGT